MKDLPPKKLDTDRTGARLEHKKGDDDQSQQPKFDISERDDQEEWAEDGPNDAAVRGEGDGVLNEQP